MAESISDIPKKRGRGRPSTGGQMPGVMVRFPAELLTELDGWIAAHSDDALSRPEAIRRLVGLGVAEHAAINGKQLEMIDRFRHERRLASRGAALALLVDIALEAATSTGRRYWDKRIVKNKAEPD